MHSCPQHGPWQDLAGMFSSLSFHFASLKEGTLSGFSGCVYEVREIALMEKRIQASLYYQLRM
jgi:hypothetical protein